MKRLLLSAVLGCMIFPSISLANHGVRFVAPRARFFAPRQQIVVQRERFVQPRQQIIFRDNYIPRQEIFLQDDCPQNFRSFQFFSH